MPQQASDVTFWLAFTAGILSFNQLDEAHPDAKVRMTVLLHTLCFIFGFSIIFILLSAIAGIASGQFLTLLREGLDWVAKIGGILTLLFGVHMTGLFSFRALLGEKREQVHKKTASFRPLGFFEVCPVFCLTAQP